MPDTRLPWQDESGDPRVRPDGLLTATCRQFKFGDFRDFSDVMAPEVSLELCWPGQPPRRLLAFPHALEDLALGHAQLEFCEPGHIARIEREERFEEAPVGLAAKFCLAPTAAPPRPAIPLAGAIAPQRVLDCMAAFIATPGRWEQTGCFHRAAARPLDSLNHDAPLSFEHWVEDIGRHNCIDRLTGRCLRLGIDPAGLALFVSARVTGSLAEKIARAGFSLVVSRSAVTTAGVACAQAAGLTLAGFSRVDRFTVFADPAARFGVQE